MLRALTAAILLAAPLTAIGADDFKVSQLEQDVRELQRQVQSLSRQIAALQTQLTRPGEPLRLPSPAPADPVTDTSWIDAAKWQRVSAGMKELEVVTLLGPPTTMRVNAGTRILLYATEVGSSGFLGGSVTLRDGAVVEVKKPVLQ
jgi:hypothetical protein